MAWYGRNLEGYGGIAPNPCWPQEAKIAVQFVLNYEEGGENCLLHGDGASEAFLSEIVGATPFVGQRHWNMESLYEYGARAGFWRLHRLFVAAGVPLTVYGVATALARSPEQVAAMQEAGWEIASHGYKWIEYKDFSREDEAAHIRAALELHCEVVGESPQGWYTGRCSMQTVELLAESGEFAYLSDVYADDLPYWQQTSSGVQLMIPYALDSNDMRFATTQGFPTAEQFFQYLKDSFDVLYAEGVSGSAKMLSVGLHCRLAGRPGRVVAIQRFLEYIHGFDGVWCPRRIEIARHWRQHHPFQKPKYQLADMTRVEFVEAFGEIFEHSPWVAEAGYDLAIKPSASGGRAVHSVLCRAFRGAGAGRRLEVLRAHPDLAGKLAAARMLGADSTSEQAAAGLDALSEEEKAEFSRLNTVYMAKFDFPFIIAAKDYHKAEILAIFAQRLERDRDAEFIAACAEVERIAALRLSALFAQTPPPRRSA